MIYQLFASDVLGWLRRNRLLECGPQIFMRVDGHLVDAHFIVKVGTCSATGLANVADDLPTLDTLTGNDRDGGEMPVERNQIVTMVEDDLPSIT